jgi:uncharacterized protein
MRHSRCGPFCVVVSLLAGSGIFYRSDVLASPARQNDSSLTSMEASAVSGDAAAQYQLAYKLLNDAQPISEPALRWLRSSAAQHFAPAQFLLGYVYEHGRGVPVDYAQAAENYRAAAQQGYAPAENNLGGLYQYGRGVARDLSTALQWYRAAAQHGNPAGQYNLASFYFLGYGTERDVDQAIPWFRAAAQHGFAAAEANLAMLYFKGIGLPMDYTEAARWSRRAAEQGLPHAAANYAYLCEHGQGVPRDYVAAYLWYARAAAAGDKSSANRLKSVGHHLSHEQLKQVQSQVVAEASRPKLAGSAASNEDPTLTETP